MKSKSNNTKIILLGLALLGGAALLGRGKSADEGSLLSGALGGSDDMFDDGSGAIVPVQSVGADQPSTISDSEMEILSASSIPINSYLGIDTGAVADLSKQTSASGVDRFAVDPSSGALVDRFRQQSINYDVAQERMDNIKPNFMDQFFGQTPKPATKNVWEVNAENNKQSIGQDVAVVGGAFGANMALPAAASKINKQLGADQQALKQSNFQKWLKDPYSIASGSKKPIVKQAGNQVLGTMPKWAKVAKGVTNFIPFFDVPIGAELDRYLTRNDENPISRKNAYIANTAGEAAQLGVTGAGALAGGFGAIPAFFLGTSADIAATEASYRSLGEQSLFGEKKEKEITKQGFVNAQSSRFGKTPKALSPTRTQSFSSIPALRSSKQRTNLLGNRSAVAAASQRSAARVAKAAASKRSSRSRRSRGKTSSRIKNFRTSFKVPKKKSYQKTSSRKKNFMNR